MLQGSGLAQFSFATTAGSQDVQSELVANVADDSKLNSTGCSGGCCCSGRCSGGGKRTNKVKFETKHGKFEVKWDTTVCSVTRGQPFKRLKVKGNQITVPAGR